MLLQLKEFPGYETATNGTYPRVVNGKTRYCTNVRLHNDNNTVDITLRFACANKDMSDLSDIDLLGVDQEPIQGIAVSVKKGADLNSIVNELLEKLIAIVEHKSIQKNFSVGEPKLKIGGFDPVNLMKIIFFVVSTLTLIMYWVKKASMWFQETKSNFFTEDSLNKRLFDGQTGKEPEFNVYADLMKAVNMLIDNDKLKAVVICGIPGTSKTHIVRRTFHFSGLKHGRDYVFLKGSTMTLLDFASALYMNRNKIVIFDDFDSPLNDPDVCNLLKSATDSYEERIISVPRINQMSSSEEQTDIELPRKFSFDGKILVITNKQFDEIDTALVSRALTVEVNFSTEEFLNNIRVMLKYISPEIPMNIKTEVLDFIAKQIADGKMKNINFRTFGNAVSIRMLYKDDWQTMILKTIH